MKRKPQVRLSFLSFPEMKIRKAFACFSLLLFFQLSVYAQQMTNRINENRSPTDAAQQLVYAIKSGEPTEALTSQISRFPFSDLQQRLTTDAHKKAFWINLYNAYTQILLLADSQQYRNRSAFFGAKKIPVAGQLFSLDMIEHGILRRSQIKWGLGHLQNPFAGSLEKTLRVDTSDYRIHFALNCGAKSCPPISFYKAEILDQQLDLATKAYLQSETTYDTAKQIVYVPKILSWFRGDFGGKRGIKDLLQQLDFIPHQKVAVRFKPYDWDLALRRFAE